MDDTFNHVGIGAFASEFGDLQRSPDTIENFAGVCAARGLSLSLVAMGCGTFWQMTKPVEHYVVKCMQASLNKGAVAPEAIDHVVFSTTDQNLRHCDENFTKRVLQELGLINAVPVFVSFQQCASSLAALDYASKLFVQPNVERVMVVAFDFVIDDAERIKPFALFGDAVASCMLSREVGEGLAFLSYAVNVDFSGLLGLDSFESREKVATHTLAQVMSQGAARIDEVEKFFSTNVYKPLATFNADICKIPRACLYIETLRERAHCGNCDWIINLIHYRERRGWAPGKKYVVQSPAPGFFACALLEAPA